MRRRRNEWKKRAHLGTHFVWDGNAMKIAPLLLLVLTLAAKARAESPDSIPNPRGRVGRSIHSSIYDGARVLSDAQKHRIDGAINALEKKTGAQMMVVTVQTLDGIPIEEWSNTLFRRIGIGHKAKNDGALWVFAMRDHKSRLEVGPGLQDRLTDARATAILDERIRPAFRSGDYGGGILSGVQTAASTIEGGTRPAASHSPSATHQTASPARNTFPSSKGNVFPGQNNLPPGNNFPSNSYPPNFYPSNSAPSPSGFPSGLILLGVLGMGGVGGLVYFNLRPRKCPQCGGAMQETEAPTEELSPANQCEQQLGSRRFVRLGCPKCGFSQIEPRSGSSSGYAQCDACQNWTAQRESRTIRRADTNSSGLEETIETCVFPPCQHVSRRERTIARLTRSSSSGGFVGGFSGGSSSDSSSSSGSSGYDGGSSGSYSGGDSDGGGGSSSW